MKYRTAVNNISFAAFHGLYPEERLTGGRFTVSAAVEQEVGDDESFASVNDVVNYESLLEIIREEMAIPRDLIEAVAKAILDRISRSFSNLSSVQVRIVKGDPGGIFKSGDASVELTRDFPAGHQGPKK